MKSKSGTFLIITGAVLIASALSLTSYNIYTDKSAGNYSEDVLQQLESEIPELEKSTEIINTEYTDLQIDSKMDFKEIDNNEYIGIIHIPSLDVKLPVMSKWNYENLKSAPCRYDGNAADGSLIIAGHNYSSHFGNLKQLSSGDEVYFINVDGNVYSYSVAETELLESNDNQKLMSGQWDLTLFTCNFSGQERVTIRCERE
jgi:sortase A